MVKFRSGHGGKQSLALACHTVLPTQALQWFVVVRILYWYLPGGNTSYVPASFDRSAQGIPGLPKPSDARHCICRLAAYRNEACPADLNRGQQDMEG